VSGLRPAPPADQGDLAAFLGRVAGLDPAAVVRLRAAGDRVTGFAMLPFGVLVSRTVAAAADPADVTVGAADLLAALERSAGGDGPDGVGWPARRDVEWRAALPPAGEWQRLDAVPGDVVRALVRAGREALRAVPAGAAGAAGESLLDHESLTVTGGGRTAVLPLRVLSALTRMGFLGGEPDLVVVSAAGGWTRLAGAYGSAYQRTTPGLGLTPR
jgi:hypothetical protein